MTLEDVTSAHLHTAALAALTAGHLAEARRLVEQGLAEPREPVERARLVRLRARLSTWTGPIPQQAWAEVVAAAEQVAEPAPELAAAMLCDAAVLAAYTRQLALAEQLATRALELTGGRGSTGALAATGLGLTYGLAGRREQAAPLLARAAELLDVEGGIVEAAEVLLPAVLAHVVQEQYDEAVDTAGRFLVAARALGAVGLLPLPLCLLAHAAWKAGRWEEQRLAASEALSLAAGTGEVALELYASAMLALVAGGQGRAAACRQRVARTLELSDRTGIGMFRVTAHMSLVHLALGTGHPADAVAPLQAVEELMAGQRRVGMLNWHADRIAVLVALGRECAAREVLDLLGGEAAGSRWERAVLPRCQAQLEPDHVRAVEPARASVELLDWQPYEQARSRLVLAQRLAALGDPAAREQAELARDAFGRLRATGWSARCEELLAAAPAPGDPTAEPPAAGALTSGALTSGAPPGCARWEIRLLGGFEVLRDQMPVPLPAGTAAQAVKYVAVRGGRVPVDDLVEALWPGAEPGRGRTRLRNVLTRLRRDAELLVRDGDEVLLCPGAVCDVDLFLAESEQGLRGDGQAALRAAARYTAELLPGDRYQDWTARARERLRERYLTLLDALAADAADRGDPDAALHWWEAALEVDRYDEERYVSIATRLLSTGRAGTAHRVARRGQEALGRLGLPPSPRLAALLRMPSG